MSKVQTAIYGCGNILFGDDGFGPTVASFLKTLKLPKDVIVEDVGTGIKDILFDYLIAPNLAPKQIIIIDAVNFPSKTPGETFKITPKEIPENKLSDFSVSIHGFPTLNMLAELSKATNIKIDIIAVQISHIPHNVRPGLSKPVSRAVKKACKIIMKEIYNNKNKNKRETLCHLR